MKIFAFPIECKNVLQLIDKKKNSLKKRILKKKEFLEKKNSQKKFFENELNFSIKISIVFFCYGISQYIKDMKLQGHESRIFFSKLEDSVPEIKVRIAFAVRTRVKSFL